MTDRTETRLAFAAVILAAIVTLGAICAVAVLSGAVQ